MEKKEEKTFGKVFSDIKGKLAELVDLREIAQAKKEDFYRDLIEAVERGYAQFSGNFFIHIMLKEEVVFDGIAHFYFVPRETPPYPVTNTILYFCDQEKDDFEVWWALPSMKTCVWFMTSEAAKVFDRDMYGTYLMVADFYCGVLDKKVDDYCNSMTKSCLRANFNPKEYDKGNLVIQAQ